jgi:beta-aspartyl-peptidase (threonine type)
MDGKTRAAGGVAGVTTVKNPISLARLVMTETKHVLLMGDGADKFADEQRQNPAIERVPNSYFSTDLRRTEWKAAVEKAAAAKALQPSSRKEGKDTVGCVALDKLGSLAAAASTGGLTNKKWGRVGSIPIVGAGAYADNRSCAVCGTGTGEEFIRNSIGFHLHALMVYRQQPLSEAVEHLVDKVLQPDSGGLVAIDNRGRIVMRCNTPGMARAATDSRGKIQVFLAR